MDRPRVERDVRESWEEEEVKLYLISQNEECYYDTFDSAVVVARNREDAKEINPAGSWGDGAWCSKPENVEVKYLGQAGKHMTRGIVCSSFNAG